ncbi:methyl-accepting chemotaxis protein [Massilia sp. 9I]|uniref:methyl-accepting chemotaxis protein n=1 Tax=Massilia sp. 9I TaxID=2653152 RepID=UPI0012F3CFBC|nr:methyl-accepting chemotaxis protein [Massilia sp. 9I]VXB95500.1 Methyl-accepting chemotaxis serine transducer [Massilia sp. 9I]
MLNNILIKTRLTAVISLLLVACVALGAGGLFALQSVNGSLKTVYEDRLIALGQLDRVVRLANRHQLMLAKALTDQDRNIAGQMDAIETDIDEGGKVWEAYSNTEMTADERMLADEFAQHRAVFIRDGVRPAITALRNGDRGTATVLVHGAVDHLYRQARPALGKLIDLQQDVGKREYESSQEHFQQFRLLVAGAMLLAAVVGTLAGWWLVRSISAPLDNAIRAARGIAAGELAQDFHIDSTNEMGRMLSALKDMSESLARTVGAVRLSSDTIAVASREIAAGNLDLSARTEQQAANLEETASSMEELTSTVQQNADNARHARQLVVKAADQAADGERVVGQVVATMDQIKDSAGRMNEIIGVIDGIAFQTNILSLNAAVEAARAGAHGAGFAVVANEVRNLAQRSAAAAKQIRDLINDSVERIGQGGALVNHAGATIGGLLLAVREVSDLMAEIAAASEEQSAGIQQVNEAVVQMDTVTQQNAALVEESAAAAASLEEQAAGLAQTVSVFRTTRAAAPARPAESTIATRLALSQ